jgi:hypothetical protein
MLSLFHLFPPPPALDSFMLPFSVASAYAHCEIASPAAHIARHVVLRVLAAATVLAAIVARKSILAVLAILVDHFAAFTAAAYL